MLIIVFDNYIFVVNLTLLSCW